MNNIAVSNQTNLVLYWMDMVITFPISKLNETDDSNQKSSSEGVTCKFNLINDHNTTTNNYKKI